jgi:hypothetical protein
VFKAPDDTRFSKKGEHDNVLPHLLTALIDPGWNGSVRWRLECPHKGADRPCALLWECTEHPRPDDPFHKPVINAELEVDPEYAEEIAAYNKAMEGWEDEHPFGSYHHTDRCWAEWALAENDWIEPEYYLEPIPAGTPLISPLKVMIGARGYGEDQEPVFRLWDDNEDGERP